jgi:hypothetical protein
VFVVELLLLSLFVEAFTSRRLVTAVDSSASMFNGSRPRWLAGAPQVTYGFTCSQILVSQARLTIPA